MGGEASLLHAGEKAVHLRSDEAVGSTLAYSTMSLHRDHGAHFEFPGAFWNWPSSHGSHAPPSSAPAEKKKVFTVGKPAPRETSDVRLCGAQQCAHRLRAREQTNVASMHTTPRRRKFA